MSPRIRLLATALLAATTLCGALLADDRTTAIDGSGATYTVSAGAYGQLFPGGTATAAANPVLALDVVPAGGAAQRLLVPGSEGPESEAGAFVILDPATQTLYTVWQSQTAKTSTIRLVGLAGGAFGSWIEASDRATTAKSALQVSITRDAYSQLPTGASAPATVQRTVLHLLWWEPVSQQSYYKPILLVGGTVMAGQPAVTLGDLDGPSPEPTAAQVSPQLYAAPSVAAGRNDHAAILGFANARTGRILSIEVSVVPGEMSELADDLRAYIEQTAAISDAQNLQSIADGVRGHIISTGVRFTDFQPGMLQFLGDAVRGHIISTGIVFDGDVMALAEDARRFALSSGANVIANGLDRPGMAPLQAAAILDLPGAPLAAGSQQVEMRITATHPAPATGDGSHTLLLSPDGLGQVVAWDGAGALSYRSWQGSAWSAANALQLGPNLSESQALALLLRSVREH